MEFNLDIPKIGYILAVRRGKKDFIGSQIERVQLKAGYKPEDACYTHTEISSGGPDSMRIMPPRAKAINIEKFYAGQYVKFLKLNDIYFDAYHRYKIALKYNLLCNKKYDYRGVLAFILSWIHQDQKKPFCAEGTAKAYQFYYPEFLKEYIPSRIFPATIVSCPMLEVHWQGFIPK